MYGLNTNQNQSNKKVIKAIEPNQTIFQKIGQGFYNLGYKLGINKPEKQDNDITISDDVSYTTVIPGEQKSDSDLVNETQNKIYEREDALRQESYDREDTKYRRAIADARLAGIDPNQLTTINTAGYTPQTSNNDAIAEEVVKQLEDGLQDQQLSNETFNKILQVVGSIIGIALFKKAK